MEAVESLTIARNSESLRKRHAVRSGCPALVSATLVLASLVLAGCTIEVGPPPESDPPLVPQKAKAPPPPPQPTEPQPWSRDLNLDSGPTRIDEDELAEGLVASDSEAVYSGERLTFESAYNDEEPKTEAERARERARARAEAAGRPAPPEVAAAPVDQVSAQELPPVGEAAAPEPGETAAPAKRDWRESRLPPPPKFPPLQQEAAETAPPEETMAASEAAAAPETVAAAPEPETILPETALGPAEPTAAEPGTGELPAVEEAAPEQTAPEQTAPEQTAPEQTVVEQAAAEQVAAVAPPAEGAPPGEAAEAAATFAAEAWDAPAGTILVQVSAVQKEESVVEEWQRLQARYPQVLKPLRLVVEEAKLGNRGVFYRVQAGAFGTEEGATAACGSLIDAGQACFVVVR